MDSIDYDRLKHNLRRHCPKCSNKMGRLASYCNACGAKLPETNPPLTPQEKTEKEEDYASMSGGKCGRFHHIVVFMCAPKGSTAYCPECGRELKSGDFKRS